MRRVERLRPAAARPPPPTTSTRGARERCGMRARKALQFGRRLEVGPGRPFAQASH